MKASIKGLEFGNIESTSDYMPKSGKYMRIKLEFMLNWNFKGFYANSYKIIGYKKGGYKKGVYKPYGEIETIFEYEIGNRKFSIVDGKETEYEEEWHDCIEFKKIAKKDIAGIARIVKKYAEENKYGKLNQRNTKVFNYILNLYLQQVKLYDQENIKKQGKRKILSLQGTISD